MKQVIIIFVLLFQLIFVVSAQPFNNTIRVFDAVQLQNAFDLCEKIPVTNIIVESTSMVLDSTLYEPLNFKANSLSIHFNSCRMDLSKFAYSSGDTVAIKREMKDLNHPDADSIADGLMSKEIWHYDLNLYGRNARGTGIEYSCSVSGGFINCYINSFHTGIILRKVLNGLMQQSQVVNCINSVRLDIGNWNRATTSNSSCNVFRFEQVRFVVRDSSDTCLVNNYGSVVVLEQCTFEGGDNKIDVLYRGGSFSKEMTKNHTYVEHNSSIAHVLSLSKDGDFYDSGTWFQKKNNVLFSCKGSGAYGRFYIEKIPWVPDGSKFEANGSSVAFIFSGVNDHWESPGRWVRSKLPVNYSGTSYLPIRNDYYSGIRYNNKTLDSLIAPLVRKY